MSKGMEISFNGLLAIPTMLLTVPKSNVQRSLREVSLTVDLQLMGVFWRLALSTMFVPITGVETDLIAITDDESFTGAIIYNIMKYFIICYYIR